MGRKLKSFGYDFNDSGELRSIKNNEPFVFTTQEQYEALGEAVTEEIYSLMESRYSLNRITLKEPECVSKEKKEKYSFFFTSENYQEAETLLVLVHGTGVVRAGQWSRRLIINENINRGTQFPYIERALANGWGVVVLNTNLTESKGIRLKNSSDPIEHACNVWKWFISPCAAEKIFVVAHSRGGPDIYHTMAKLELQDEKVRAVCLTDSFGIDKFPTQDANKKSRKNPLLVVNFQAHGSYDDRIYAVTGQKGIKNVQNLYAGTQIHEESSACAIEAIFHIFENEITRDSFEEVLHQAKKIVRQTNI
ncbi:unnamed protein product [Caenorhabditis auriculariae]|uniref:Arb2 domain-containing protein n=1 Tax=Caenorhabditis auriculariae TaxID=2777116 RepID=A0A8S1GVP0_9PELO|nr:unnamed protein product [Caenorhabditis auriculariae]